MYTIGQQKEEDRKEFVCDKTGLIAGFVEIFPNHKCFLVFYKKIC